MGFEESLIRFVAPTLAGIKVANLYNYQFSCMQECMDAIEQFNQQLNHKGIRIELMKYHKGYYLLYVYRPGKLQRLLENQAIAEFLSEYGYQTTGEPAVSDYIRHLKTQINASAHFPHEIGVFLGYPLADVKEFIARGGEGCALCGEWKVYYDVQDAARFFGKLQKCKDVYLRIYSTGRSLYDMTVSA